MLDVMPGVKGLVFLTLVAVLYYAFLAQIPTYAYVSREIYLLETTEVLLTKTLGEAFSYAYYLEANATFDVNTYSDDEEEIWEVPYWFAFPKANSQASCRSVYGEGLSCVVWNLTDFTDIDPTNPKACPPVVGYSFSPPPLEGLDIADDNLNEVVDMIKNGYMSREGLEQILGRYGVTFSLDNAHVTRNGTTYTISPTSASISIGLLSKQFQTPQWHFEVRLEPVTEHAYCTCYNGSGEIGTVTYTVVSYYLHVVGRLGGSTGIKLLDENTHVITYFTGGSGGIDPADLGTNGYCKFTFDWEKKMGIHG